MAGEPTADETSFWLPVLSELTKSFPTFGVWKGLEGALAGSGDVDAVGGRNSRSGISNAFEAWSLNQGASAVIGCHHVPGVVHLLALFPKWVEELDVCDEFYWRGSVLVTGDQLTPLMRADRGLRCLRPGARGLLVLLLNGVRRGGGIDSHAVREKGVERLLSDDPLGVQQAAALLGRGDKAALQLAEAVAAGRSRRGAALRLEARALLRATFQPGHAAARLRFRLISSRRCPVLQIVRNRRSLPSDPDAWLDQVGASHRVVRA